MLSLLLDAAWMTLGLALASLVGGMVLALAFSAAELSKQRWLVWPVATLTTLIRGLPELLVVLFIYFGSTQVLFLITGEYVEFSPFACGVLADIFIGRESELYREKASQDGGWQGTRPFIIKEKRQESELITSFVLAPLDGNPVLRFKPGQYLSIKLVHPALEHQEIRQYSLSDAPNGRDYRISVKREPRGQASNLLHDHLHIGDTVDIMPPAGDFFLQEVTDTPVVLISAGVGLTPMLSMLNHLLAEGPDMDIRWLHACEHGAHHAFRDEIRAKSRQHGKLESRIWYREPGEQDVKGEDYDFSGTLALEQVTDLIPADAHYYFCGPVPFMKAVKAQLENVGVPAERMHYEVFGPHQGL